MSSDVTRILAAIEEGDQRASEKLLPLVYDELRKLAAVKLSQEKPGQTLQATALVHEAYIRLVDVDKAQHWNSRGHFFAAAAEAIRRILIDRARRKRRPKHGGDRERVDLNAVCIVSDDRAEELLSLEAALRKLAAESPQKAELVKLRYFAGMSHQEAAKAVGISRATADRFWAYAKSFLYCEMQDSSEILKNLPGREAFGRETRHCSLERNFLRISHMDPEQGAVETIFLAALEKTNAEERSAYLDKACETDRKLRARVERLLRAQPEVDSFLEAPAPELAEITCEPVLEKPGSQVGPYKLLEEIGEGGFGVVYMAEQEEPVRRRVALKVIKPGMDSRDVIARFDAERQALAMMDHPNVARVLDAGATSQGRPYFVMDLIKGIPITEYADEASLSTRERLDLFLEVCQGVQHAHQKGIIHRDLKPTNVLVTLHGSRPVPKVIDFGVAKAIHQRLTERTLHTRHRQMIGTPLYMSPEQAALSGLDVDTRSDIYSLGVLLYELLTGTTPLECGQLGEASYDEIRRAIRETEPPTPSQRLQTTNAETLKGIAACRRTDPRKVAELLRGDLDWITMKALEKDRTRRYETASAFAQDIGRYLSDEPIEARPPSRRYRVRKFVRRNRAGLSVALCVLVALVAVVGSAGWLVGERAARLGEAGRLARSALADTETAMKARDWDRARMAVMRAEGLVVRRGARREVATRVEELVRDLDMVARLEAIDFELASRNRAIGFDHAGAAAQYAKAFADYGLAVEALAASDAAARIRERPVALELAAGLEKWAFSLAMATKKEAAGWKHLFAIAREADPDPVRNRVRELWEAGDHETLAQLAAAAAIEKLSAFSAARMASALATAGRHEPAVELLERVQPRYPADFWINYGLASSLLKLGRWDEMRRFSSIAVALRPGSPAAHNSLGIALTGKGLLDRAIAEYREALRLDPDDALVHHNLGRALQEKGLLDEAIAQLREALRLEPDFGEAHTTLGVALQEKGLLDEAIAHYRQATRLDPDYAEAHSNLGNSLRMTGLLDEAVAECREALRLEPGLAVAHNNLGAALADKGLLDEAIAECREALRLDPELAMAHNSLGAALADKGLLDEAIAAYREALRLDPDFKAHYNLGNALSKKGLLDEAIAAYREALRLDPDYAFAHINLGNALSDKGLLDEAIAEYREALRLDPSYAPAHNNLGNALSKTGLLDEAIAEYREALRLDPGFRLAFHQLCQNGDFSGALAHASEFVEREPENPVAHTLLGDVLDDVRKLGEATACYEKALALKPDYAPARFGLGNVRRHAKDYPGAIAEYREALRLDPDFAWAYRNLGLVYELQGNYEAAIRAYRKSIDLEPANSIGHQSLGRVLGRNGDLPGAVTQWLKAVELSPNNLQLRNQLAWILATASDVRVRDPERAVELAKKAVESAPKEGNFWNTLGVALHYAGDFAEAGLALEKSMELGQGGNGFDWFFLAMAEWQLGKKEEGRQWYRKAVEWSEKNAKENGELRRFRGEAEELMGIDPPAATQNGGE